MPLARTKAAYYDIKSADDEHIKDAVLAGGVVMIEDGIPCTLLERGPDYFKVRLLDGKHKGLEGYVWQVEVWR